MNGGNLGDTEQRPQGIAFRRNCAIIGNEWRG